MELIKQHRTNGIAVLSIQVLQEFVNVALRKLRLPRALAHPASGHRERLSSGC